MFFFFFPLVSSRVAAADFPSPFIPIFCILLRHFNRCHVLSHRIHKPPFRPSPFPLSWQFHPQHPSPNIPIIFPPYMSIPPQSCLSCVLSKPNVSQMVSRVKELHERPRNLIQYMSLNYDNKQPIYKRLAVLCTSLDRYHPAHSDSQPLVSPPYKDI